MNVIIEYCVKWNYGPDFDRVSKLIKNVKSTAKIIGNPMPPRSGAFEITIDGKQIFSKFENGRFPSDSDVNSCF